MWLLLATTAWAQDAGSLLFAAEHLGVATSAAVARGTGVVVELQGQSLVLPGAVPPQGIDVLPVLPRLAIGGTGGDRTRWAAGAHGTGLIPLGGDDVGVGGGAYGGVAFGARGLWSGLELDATYAKLMGGQAFDHLAMAFHSVIGGDIDRTTSLFFRFGGAGTLAGDQPLAVSPRAGLGLGYRPHSSAVLGLALHLALLEEDPRVPWTGVLSLAWRFGATQSPAEPEPVVVAPAPTQAPAIKEVVHPLLTCGEGQVATGSPPPYGKEAWCAVVTDENKIQREGPYIRWHDAKFVAEQGQFAENRRVGEWKEYSGNGTLLGQGSYENDEKHGPWKTWFPNGALASEGAYWNGLKDGDWVYYSLDGSKTVGFWEAGDREGEWFDYDASGNVTRKRVWKEGRMMHQELNP